MGKPDWDRVREEFPALANWTYLNTATYGQMPRQAAAAVARHFEHRDETACADFLAWFEDADQIRADCASLIHARPDDIAFIPNAATALGWLLGGLQWRDGDQILSPAGEFPNNLYAPSVCAASGVEHISAEPDTVLDAITDRTRLLLISSVNYTTGFRPPLRKISERLHRHGGLLYVDGTQGVGALQFDVGDLQPDMLAVHGYKWLLSPNGAGFCYIRPELRRVLNPTQIGWRSDRRWRQVNELHHGVPEFVESAERYEGGMLNFPSLYGMGASVRMILELGPDQIEARVLELTSLCEQVLAAAGGAVAHSGTPVLSAKFDGDAAAMAASLRSERILVSARHGRLRVSVHFYNNEADLEKLAGALRHDSIRSGRHRQP